MSETNELTELRAQLAQTKEMASIALDTALAAVGAASVIIQAIESKMSTSEERAVLGGAKVMLIDAEKRIIDWMVS